MSCIIVSTPDNPDEGIMVNVTFNNTVKEVKENYFNIVKSRANDDWKLVEDSDEEIESDLNDDNRTLASYGLQCGDLVKAYPSSKETK